MPKHELIADGETLVEMAVNEQGILARLDVLQRDVSDVREQQRRIMALLEMADQQRTMLEATPGLWSVGDEFWRNSKESGDDRDARADRGGPSDSGSDRAGRSASGQRRGLGGGVVMSTYKERVDECRKAGKHPQSMSLKECVHCKEVTPIPNAEEVCVVCLLAGLGPDRGR